MTRAQEACSRIEEEEKERENNPFLYVKKESEEK